MQKSEDGARGLEVQLATEQKQSLRSVTCNLTCNGSRVAPDAGAARPDPSDVTSASGNVKGEVVNAIGRGDAVDPGMALKFLNSELQKRIVVLDGCMSSEIAKRSLTEDDYRGELCKDSKVALKGNDALLALTKPDLIENIHKSFFKAGADICRTITRNCNAISQGPWLMQSKVYEMNKAAAVAAKKAAVAVTEENNAKPRFVAGTVGPTDCTLSVSPTSGDVAKHASYRKSSSYVGRSHAPECKQYGTTTDRFGHVAAEGPLKGNYFSSKAWREWLMCPSARWPEDGVFESVTFDEMVEAYLEQICGLVDGGVDMLLFEAVVDTLNAKAAIYALELYYEQFKKDRLPLIINASLSSDTGRMPSGQNIEAFFISIKHAKPMAVGMDGECSPSQMKAFYKSLMDCNTTYCSMCPAAAAPAQFASDILAYGKAGQLNFVGAGLGSLPAHIEELTKAIKDCSPRKLVDKEPCLMLAGLDPCLINKAAGINLVGGRCNLLGENDQFRQAMYECKFHSAVSICASQVDRGADILDVNLDSTWEEFDSASAMTAFISSCAMDSKVAKVPLMIGSHLWPTVEGSLKHVQGKCIVSAIGLTLSEEKFIMAAEKARRYGAAIVVRAMSDSSTGESYEDKVSICQKSYDLLRKKLDFPPEDIIFDCNVMPLAKGDKASRASDFLRAVAEVKRSCPHVSFIGGIGNLSLPFQWVPGIREALHTVFLRLAIERGLNLAICDVGALPVVSEIDSDTKNVCEKAILNHSASEEPIENLRNLAGMIVGMEIEMASEPAAPQQAVALPDTQQRSRQKLITPITTFVQSAGALSTNAFVSVGSKAHSAWCIHRTMVTSEVTRTVAFSSISVWMGQGGAYTAPAASGMLDGFAFWSRWQQLDNMATTVQWGPIGGIGLRLVVFGSRDVFAQFDVGQKLISAADSAIIERGIFLSHAPEFLGIAYIDETLQCNWEGKVLVKVRDQQFVSSFKIKKTTPLFRLVDVYRQQKIRSGLQAGDIQLAFKGKAIASTDTCQSLGMASGDFIEAIEF